MATMKAKYLGQLRVECEHVASGTKMMTDAPVDNCGKGEAFSPTDLCAAALGSCILTTMGIYAGLHNIDLEGTEMEITKTRAPAYCKNRNRYFYACESLFCQRPDCFGAGGTDLSRLL